MATNALPGGFDPALLRELEAALAQHLGPIARVAVHDAAQTAGTLAELVRLLAWEIPDAAKAAFQKAKTAGRGGKLEDRVMQQVRSNLRLVEKAGPKKSPKPKAPTAK